MKMLQLQHLFQQSVEQYPDNIALICDGELLSYRELDRKTNQLANYLLSQGLGKNSKIGVLLERSVNCYLSFLAILKINAVYIPLEIESPDERINLILADLPFDLVLTSSLLARRTQIAFPKTMILDTVGSFIHQQDSVALGLEPAESSTEDTCYIIYTSGSTGKPKGVDISHRSICHYVRVASELYEMTPQDRVYQGFSLAFDASMEEVFMALANGAALIACTNKDTRFGVGLIEFLNEQQVSVFSTTPALMTSLAGELPQLRLLIFGGEVCPGHLVQAWSRPGLRILNTYGPTEATVIATYAECERDKPVTIGRPLPGYEVYLFDEHLNAVPLGEEGEIYLGGAGIAKGYVNREDSTKLKFIPHPNDPHQRLYRTGDLGVLSADGELHYAGRMDDQIKLRGFRIELNEIESIIMEHPSISEAVVLLQTLDEPTLVAYLIVDKEKPLDWALFKEFLASRLPLHMMPGFYMHLDAFPLLSSGKVDRKAMPKPLPRAEAKNHVAPVTEVEKLMAKVWEETFKLSPVSTTADFFYDLGGHSLLAARVISNLRKHASFKDLSVVDLYNHPTIVSLAQEVEQKVSPARSESRSERHSASTLSYYLCGIGQFFGCLLQLGFTVWPLLLVIIYYNRLQETQSLFSQDSLVKFAVLFMMFPIINAIVTIAAKWLLLGRVKPGEHPVWGWYYCRWWLVRSLEKNLFPVKYIAGTPLIGLYFRLMGAKIGKNTYIGSAKFYAYDVVSIGDNTSIGCDTRILNHILEDGWLKIGTVSIGNNCFIGSRSLLNINVTLEDGAILDDLSMLKTNSRMGQGEFFAGSPARNTKAPLDHLAMQKQKESRATTFQVFRYGMWHYMALFLITILHFTCYLPSLEFLLHFYEQESPLYIYFLLIPVGALIYLTLSYTTLILVKKLILNKVTPGTYSIYSFFYLRQWVINQMLDTDEIDVMGDSLYFPMLMRRLGAKLGKDVEMGRTPHSLPDLMTIDDYGFVASSAAIAWPVVYDNFICFDRVHIGKESFVGNFSVVPGGTDFGDKTLLGAMSVPPKVEVRLESNTSWFGSPAVFLPIREQIRQYSEAETTKPPRRLYVQRLAIELVRIMLPTACFLGMSLSLFFIINKLLETTSFLNMILVMPLAGLLVNGTIVAFIILLKWLVLGKAQPTTKPLWDLFIRKIDLAEYHFIHITSPLLANFLLGTPFISHLYRALGAKIGKRTLIDTPEFPEFDLIEIHDEVCLNTDALLLTHLYEDRIFKASNLIIKEGCNVGVCSIILYDTVMEKNSTLGSLSLLMKGESLEQNTRWEGIPAQSEQMTTHHHASLAPEMVKGLALAEE